MLGHKKIAAQERKGNGPKTRKKAEDPAVEEKIQILARRCRSKLVELERIASGPSRTMEERLRAISDINRKKQEFGEEITKTEAELQHVREEIASRREYVRKVRLGMAARDEYKLKRAYSEDNSGEKTTLVLLEELHKTRDQCQFVLERLTSSADPEIRSRAFDLIVDNLIAVKLTCLDSPYPDIRNRAREALRSKENRYFTRYQPKETPEYLVRPEFMRFSRMR